MTDRVLLVTTAPAEAVDAVLNAIAEAGGGVIGSYTHCAFMNSGQGRFRPDKTANPHSGQRETINSVDEMRIESFCERDQARAVADAVKAAHPYEQPVIYLIPLLDVDAL